MQAAQSAAYAFVSTARVAGLQYSVPAHLQAMQSIRDRYRQIQISVVVSRCTFGCQNWGPKFLDPGASLDLKLQTVVNKAVQGLHRLPNA